MARGHIRQRGTNWAVIIDHGRDENGKRKQKWHSGYRTRGEAERAPDRLPGRQGQRRAPR